MVWHFSMAILKPIWYTCTLEHIHLLLVEFTHGHSVGVTLGCVEAGTKTRDTTMSVRLPGCNFW